MRVGETIFALAFLAMAGVCVLIAIDIAAQAHAREATERDARINRQLNTIQSGRLKRELEREQELAMRDHLATHHAEADQ